MAPNRPQSDALSEAQIERLRAIFRKAGGYTHTPWSISDADKLCDMALESLRSTTPASARAIELLQKARGFMEAMTDRFTSYAEFRVITLQIDQFLAATLTAAVPEERSGVGVVEALEIMNAPQSEIQQGDTAKPEGGDPHIVAILAELEKHVTTKSRDPMFRSGYMMGAQEALAAYTGPRAETPRGDTAKAIDDALDELGKAFGNDWNEEQGNAMDRVRDATLAALRSNGSSAKVPEGWKLVPVEPTPEMVAAVRWTSSGWVDGKKYAADTYRAMLAASPSSQEQPK